MKFTNRLCHCLATGIPLVLLAACSTASGGATGALLPPEVTSIVLDTVPTGDTAGIYLAEDDGFFARQGLNVKIVLVGGAEYGMGDLQTGKAQLIEGNYVSFILAQIAGEFAAPDPANPKSAEPVRPINLRIVADTSQMQPGNQALYVLPKAPYKTVRDLVRDHATIGVNAQHNIGTLLLGSLLASFGYRANAVRQVTEDRTQMPRLLAEHKIAAAWLPEPLGTEAEQQYGAVPLADFDQGALQGLPDRHDRRHLVLGAGAPEHGRRLPARVRLVRVEMEGVAG